MIIESNPCKNCECSPAFCDGDIEICQITRGQSKPVSDEQYQKEQLEQYKADYNHSCRSEVR